MNRHPANRRDGQSPAAASLAAASPAASNDAPRRYRNAVAIAASIALLAGYAVAAVRITHLRVGPSYRAYYIEHRVSGWHTNVYRVPETVGIDFSRPGRPTFVRSIGGLSAPDVFGSWTDARLSEGATIRYQAPFSGPVCVILKAQPSPANIGAASYVQMGAESLAFATPNAYPIWHRLQFTVNPPASIVRVFPGVTERKSARDARRIGLRLIRLITVPGTC